MLIEEETRELGDVVVGDLEMLFICMKCKYCNKEFEPTHGRQKHCTKKCKNEFRWRKQLYQNGFGITIEDYNRMFLEQEGKCKICKQHQTAFKKRFAVDHDHKNGRVRGLLCDACNTGLGGFLDNPDYLRSAIEYLNVS